MATLRYPNKSLIENSPKTFLATDYNSTNQSSVSAENAVIGTGYSYVVLEEIGNERWEVLQISSISGQTINLVENTTATHVKGTSVYFVNYNQIEFSYASTVAGSKSVLLKKDIAGSDKYTFHSDTSNTSGFAFVRLYSEADAEYSGYSSAIPYTYTRKSARELKKLALAILNEDTTTLITDDFVYQVINACESEVANMRKKGKWGWLRKGNHVLGTLNEGQWRLSLPSDIQDTDTNESIYTAKFGRNYDMTYIDAEEFNHITARMAYTQVNGNQVSGAVTITGLDFSNFPAKGTVRIGTNNISYTGKTATTLTGVTGFTANITDGDFIFYQASFSEPKYYTIKDNFMYVYPVVSNNFAGNSLIIDYYHTPGNITQGYDETNIPDETLVVDYLVSKIDLRLNGLTQLGIEHKNNYLIKADRLQRQDSSGRRVHFRPAIERKIVKLSKHDYTD